MFTLRASRRGGHELRTSVYPSNLAPIAAKLRQRAFQTICNFRFFDAESFFLGKMFRFFFRFSSFSVDFRGARVFLTSESNSSRFFALDGQIFRSVRPLELIFRFFTVRTSTCGGKCLWRLWKSVGLRFQGLEVVWLKNTFCSRFDFHFKPHDFHFKPCDFQFKPGNF